MNLGNVLFLYTGCDQPIDLPLYHKKCGLILKEPTAQASSNRISNAKESEVHYPWVVRVSREYTNLPVTYTGTCTGTIINSR